MHTHCVCLRILTCTYMYVCVCVYLHTYTHNTHTNTYILMYTYIYKCIHADRHTDIQTYRHTYIHAIHIHPIHPCIHAYALNMHTCMHTYSQGGVSAAASSIELPSTLPRFRSPTLPGKYLRDQMEMAGLERAGENGYSVTAGALLRLDHVLVVWQ